jgi:uncharacterized protein YndB with AHSA1/START domain
MLVQSNTEAIRRTLVVPVPVERAFELFTNGIGLWWPAANSCSKEDLATVVLETEVGGRWFELNMDGLVTQWGQVLAWEPPQRLVLSWQLTAAGEPEPDPARASEVEIRFRTEEPAATRLELEHRAFAHHGNRGAISCRVNMDSVAGWDRILRCYAATVS